MIVLAESQWRPFAAAHAERVERLTTGHLARRQAGEHHAVEDFLFVYYQHRPGQMRRWHPGPGVALEAAAERDDWSLYQRVDGAAGSPGGRPAWTVDLPQWRERRGSTARFVRELLARTMGRPAQHACFGLHEWAMVYGSREGERRHEALPLRLPQRQVDAVVEASQLRCTHHDAYRFFTPAAAPLNETAPTREGQVGSEQPGCLHAGMDLYKWCFKLGPVVPGDLLLDAFEVARAIRALDMQASPYDVSRFGLDAVPVETAAGRAEYVRRQRAFTEQTQGLRERLVAVIDEALGAEEVAEEV